MEAEVVIFQEPRQIGSRDRTAIQPNQGRRNIEGVDSESEDHQEAEHLQNRHNGQRGGFHPCPRHYERGTHGGIHPHSQRVRQNTHGGQPNMRTG